MHTVHAGILAQVQDQALPGGVGVAQEAEGKSLRN